MTPTPEPAAATPAPDRWDAALMVVLVVVAAWLRWDGLSRGYSSDELANVMTGDAWAVLTDVEAGVNPPALRVMFNAPLDDWDTPRVGRWFSMACSVVSVALAYLVGRRAARGWRGAGLFAAALVAVHPMSVAYASIFRIYAWWMAVGLLHVWALGHALDARSAGPRRRWAAVALVSAMVWPWVHYVAVPVLLGLGLALAVGMPGRRRWVMGYVPAALAISPMIPFVLTSTGRRVAPGEDLGVTMGKVLSLGLTPPMALANPAARLWRDGLDLPFHWPEWMAMSMLGFLVVGVLAWPRASSTLRLCVAGAWSVFAAVYVLGQVQWVRDPTMLMMMVFLAPLVGGVCGLVPLVGGRWLVLAATGWWMTAQMGDMAAWYGERVAERDRPRELALALPELLAAHGAASARVQPGYFVPTLYFYLAQQHFGRQEQTAPCVGLQPCFEWEGSVVAAGDAVGSGAALDGLLISFDPEPRAGLGSACTLLSAASGLTVWRCGPPEDPQAPRGGRDGEAG